MPREFDGGRPPRTGKEALVVALLATGAGLASCRALDVDPFAATTRAVKEPAVAHEPGLTLEPVLFAAHPVDAAGRPDEAIDIKDEPGALAGPWQVPFPEPAGQVAVPAVPAPSFASGDAFAFAAGAPVPRPVEAASMHGSSPAAQIEAAAPGDSFAEAFAFLNRAAPAVPAETGAAADGPARARFAAIPAAADTAEVAMDAGRIAASEPAAPAPPVFSEPPQAVIQLAASQPVLVAAVAIEVEPLEMGATGPGLASTPQLAALEETPVGDISSAPDAAPDALAEAEPTPERLAAPREKEPLPAVRTASAEVAEGLAPPDAEPTERWTSALLDAGGWTLDGLDASAGAGPETAGSVRRTPMRKLALATGKYRVTGRGIEFALPVVIHGDAGTPVPLLIDPDQNVSMRLVDLLALVEPMLPVSEFGRLAMAESAQEYVSLRHLRSRGMDFRYDAARNRLVLEDT